MKELHDHTLWLLSSATASAAAARRRQLRSILCVFGEGLYANVGLQVLSFTYAHAFLLLSSQAVPCARADSKIVGTLREVCRGNRFTRKKGHMRGLMTYGTGSKFQPDFMMESD